jgi:type II secretory pathway component PulF
MDNSAGPLALIGLILIGFALLWARQIVYRTQARQHRDVPRLVLSLAGSLLILVGLLGGAAHMTMLLAPLACGSMLIVVMMLVMRYRALERRSLLKYISVAAEKGIPLNQAVRGFANERTDELGYRASILAEALEGGMNLPDGLRHSKTGLTIEALLALRLGYETGTLGPAVARVAKVDENLDMVARSLFEKFLYLGTMVWVMAGCVTFFMLKIVPILQKMLVEFNTPLPALTRLNIQFADAFPPYGFALMPLMILAGFILLAAGLHYVGLLPRDVPLVSNFTRRFDAALIMRSLALAVSLAWPMNKTVWMLARIYPARSVRGRLVAAGRRIDNGENWCDSLFRAGLLTKADWAVLNAAQRCGNVEWALEEMADSSVRRLIYRWQLVLNIAFPAVLLSFGLLVAFFVIGFFLPLVSLIQSLL